MRFRTSKTGLSLTVVFYDHFKAVPLFQFFFVRASLVSYVALVLPLSFPLLSLLCYIWKAVLRDLSIYRVSSLIIVLKISTPLKLGKNCSRWHHISNFIFISEKQQQQQQQNK